jgi:hypothetical protein
LRGNVRRDGGNVLVTLTAAAVLLACSDYGFGDPLSPPADKAPSSDTGPSDSGPSDPGPTTSIPSTEPTDSDPEAPGLVGGHFDVDYSAALYPVDIGTTDGHVHQYDDLFDVAGVDFLDPLHSELQPLADVIEDPDLEFVVIAANPDLSPGARLALDALYDASDPGSFVEVGAYAATPIAALPRYTLRSLPALGVWFAPDAIASGELVGSETACVRNNTPGPNGEWRNGALTLQAVRADRIDTDTGLSAGGVHGVQVDAGGLLWEGVVFWHWPANCR